MRDVERVERVAEIVERLLRRGLVEHPGERVREAARRDGDAAPPRLDARVPGGFLGAARQSPMLAVHCLKLGGEPDSSRIAIACAATGDPSVVPTRQLRTFAARVSQRSISSTATRLSRSRVWTPRK